MEEIKVASSWQSGSVETDAMLAKLSKTFIDGAITLIDDENRSEHDPEYYITLSLNGGEERDEITLITEIDANSSGNLIGNEERTSEIEGTYVEYYPERSSSGNYSVKSTLKKREIKYKIIFSREHALDVLTAEYIEDVLLTAIGEAFETSNIFAIEDDE